MLSFAYSASLHAKQIGPKQSAGSTPLPQNSILWPIKGTNFLPTSTMNKAPRERKPPRIVAGFFYQRHQYYEDNIHGLTSWILCCICSQFKFYMYFMWFCSPPVQTLDVYATSTQAFVVASFLFHSCISCRSKLATELGKESVSSVSFIHHFSPLVLTNFCNPVFPHHPLYAMMPWSVRGKLPCTQQVRSSAMEHALNVLPNLWTAESLCAVVMPGTTRFVFAQDWENWCKGPLKTSLRLLAVLAKSWHGVQKIRRGGCRARGCYGNYLIKRRKWKLMPDIKYI